MGVIGMSEIRYDQTPLSEKYPEARFPMGFTTPNDTVMDVWPRVAPLFSGFEQFEPKRYSLSDVYSNLVQGTMQLHVSHDGEKFHFAMLTEIAEYPRAKVCVIYFGVGEQLEKAFPLFHYVVEWAKRREVDEFEIIGRPGFERMLKPLGFYKHAVVMYKRIE